MDLAKYHGCSSVIQPLLEAGISVLFLPPSSSNLNPIEKLWGIVKANLTKRRAQYSAQDVNKLLKYDLLEETQQSFTDVLNGKDHKKVRGDELANHVFKEMVKVVDGKVV